MVSDYMRYLEYKFPSNFPNPVESSLTSYGADFSYGRSVAAAPTGLEQR